MADGFQTVRQGRGPVMQAPNLPIVVNPPNERPALQVPDNQRYRLTASMAGSIERLAHARFVIRELLADRAEGWIELEDQGHRLSKDESPIVDIASEDEVIGTIAQSVFASSEIEGEAVYAKDANLAIVGKADAKQLKQGDYAERVESARAIYGAYVWALTKEYPLEGGKAVSVEFIREMHRRMFAKTKPNAGAFKTRDNAIERGGQIVLRMLPHTRVELFIHALCDRLNTQFRVADTSGRYSKLLSIGEFLVDFLAIHPFADGNGRCARLLSTYLLERAGFHFARFYSLDTIILEQQQEYYRALMFSQAEWFTEREDLSPWMTFYLDAVFTQWTRAYDHISRQARRESVAAGE